MPYKCKRVGSKWVVHKETSKDKWEVLSSSGRHGTLAECNRQVRALYWKESQEVKDEVVLELNGVIGEDFTKDYFEYQLSNVIGDTVRINIASRGGDYIAALEIYNKLRECKKKVITSAQGLVASAGTVILLAGEEIEAAENAVFMFHMPQVLLNEPVDADELRKKAEALGAMEDSLIKTVQSRTGWEDAKTRNFLKAENVYTAEEMLDMKLIDRILPFMRRKVEVTNLKGIKPTDKIIAFVEEKNKEFEKMALKDVCAQFSLKVEDSFTEDQLQETIVNHINELTAKLTDTQKKLTEAEGKLPKTPVVLSTAIRNILKKGRTAELNGLVAVGKITPVVATDLTSIFISDANIDKFVDENGEIRDAFDATITALAKNEPVISFNSKSGFQTTPKGITTDPLVADAERRAAAAKQ